MSEKEKDLLVSEVNIIKTLQSPFIVKYYDRIIEREQKVWNAQIFIVRKYTLLWNIVRVVIWMPSSNNM